LHNKEEQECRKQCKPSASRSLFPNYSGNSSTFKSRSYKGTMCRDVQARKNYDGIFFPLSSRHSTRTTTMQVFLSISTSSTAVASATMDQPKMRASPHWTGSSD